MTKKVVISFPDGEASRPLIYELIKKFDIMVSIIKADIDGGRSGKLVLELDSDSEHIRQAIDFMQQSGVNFFVLEGVLFGMALAIAIFAYMMWKKHLRTPVSEPAF